MKWKICYFLHNLKNCNNFKKSNIEEKWGILLKNKKIEDIKAKYENLKNEDKDLIQNNLIKLKEIINNSDNLEEFYTQIFDMEPLYSWVARISYDNMLAREKPDWLQKFHNKFHKQNKAIKEFENVKTIIDTFIGDLSSQSSLNKLTFSFF